MENNKYFKVINLKNGLSPNYLMNNFKRSDNFCACVKNSFGKSSIVIYSLEDLENDSTPPDMVEQKTIEWESIDKECTHINYLKINNNWYLIVGFIGQYEIYNEDGTKKYNFALSSDSAKQENNLMRACFLSSCVGYSQGEEYLVLGNSIGEIIQI